MKTKLKPHLKTSVVNRVRDLTAARREVFTTARSHAIPVRQAIQRLRNLDSERRAMLT